MPLHSESRQDGKNPPSSFGLLFPWIVATAIPTLVYLMVILVGYDAFPYLRGDCPYYYLTSVSLLHDRDLDLGNQLPPPIERHSYDVSLDQRNRLVPKHPIWMAVAAMPLIAILGVPGALVFNVLQMVLLIVLTMKLTLRFASPWAAALAVALTGAASFLPHYAWNFSPDVFSSLLLVAGLVALPADRSPERARHAVAGLLVGFSVISKFPLILTAPLLILICGKPYRQTLPALAVGFALPFALLFALNTHLFGSPMTTSYDRMVGFEGPWMVVRSHRNDFNQPMVNGAQAQVVDPTHGLLRTSPITILSLAGILALGRRNWRWAIYLTVSLGGLFLLFSTYQHWDSSHYGNRFLMPLAVLAAIPLASLFDATVLRRYRACEQATESV